MEYDVNDLLRQRLTGESYERLMALNLPHVHAFVADAVALCNPRDVFVSASTPEDIAFIRQQAIERGEERKLAIEGHTIHFDGMQDQGRDRKATKYLVPEDDSLSDALNQMEREAGLEEVRGHLKDSMTDRTMIVRFLSLGPADSVFSIPCVQITDSFYVAHSEDLLYRPCYPQFKKLAPDAKPFRFLHSAGKLNDRRVSAEPDKKCIYIDYTRDTVYSANTQYAGNTVGLKKLALRLTIRKADREGWLAEHMFLMGVHGLNGRKTYFAGAFPSACGKTSTAMLPGETVVGDDIAYLRHVNGKVHSVNAEHGIFGIIRDVNSEGDPSIWQVITTPGEVIFSNVLIKDGKPYWLGMGRDLPESGENFSGEWHKGKTDADGSEIPPAHKNARYCVRLPALPNVDEALDDPDGVPVGGIMYGGRDARAWLPVQQSFDWTHGIVAYGASLETETTFATLGKEGVNEINLMSIQDFLAIPLGKYVRNNLDFGNAVENPPLIFAVNYFLRDADGRFLNEVRDKAVWVKWMERRVHGDAGAIRTPTGFIPEYEDLARLFREVLDKEYSEADYTAQFSLRVKANIEKLDRVETFHRENVQDAPDAVFDVLAAQRKRLLAAQETFGDVASPFGFK